MPTRLLALFLCALCLLFAATATAQNRILPTDDNVLYGDETQRDRRLDVYLPENAEPPYPVVLMFHGAPGDKSNLRDEGIPQVVTDAGAAAVIINYETTLPAAYDDAYCALAWVAAHADEYNFDPTRIATYGMSYGGFPAAMLAAVDDPSMFVQSCPYMLPDPVEISGVIANSGVLFGSLDSVLHYEPELAVSAETLELLRETPPQDWHTLDLTDDERATLALFTAYWVDGSEPPHLLIHGVGDSIIPYTFTYDYAELLSSNEVSVTVLMDRLAGHVPGPRLFDQEMVAFLGRVFAE